MNREDFPTPITVNTHNGPSSHLALTHGGGGGSSPVMRKAKPPCTYGVGFEAVRKKSYAKAIKDSPLTGAGGAPPGPGPISYPRQGVLGLYQLIQIYIYIYSYITAPLRG